MIIVYPANDQTDNLVGYDIIVSPMKTQQIDDLVVIEGHITTDIPNLPGVMGRLTFRIVEDAATRETLIDQSSATYRLAGIVSRPDSEVPIDQVADAVGDGAIKVKCKNCRAILAVFKPGALDASVGILNVACPICGTHRRIIPPRSKGSKKP